jgi:hypothetical protein
MKFIANAISTAWSAIRPARLLLTALVCTVLFFSSMNPAQADYTSKSKPTDGENRLQKIDDKAQESIDQPPMTLKDVEERNKNGLNEIQGSADKNKMYTSKSSKPAVTDKMEKAMDKITK